MDTQQTSLTMQHPIAYGARGNAQALRPILSESVLHSNLPKQVKFFLSIAYSRDHTHVRIMHSSKPCMRLASFPGSRASLSSILRSSHGSTVDQHFRCF